MDDSDSDEYDRPRRFPEMERCRKTFLMPRRGFEDERIRRHTLRPMESREAMEKRLYGVRRELPQYRGTYDSDEGEYAPSNQGNQSPPLTMIYKPTKDNKIVPINSIIEPPGRHRRSYRMVIIIRGPYASGKSYLADRILEREHIHGNSRARKITGIKKDRAAGDKSIKDGPKYLFYEFQEAVKNNVNFIVIEVKSRKTEIINDLAYMSRSADYDVYAIDIKIDTCSKSYKARMKELRWYQFEQMSTAYATAQKYHDMPHYVTLINPVGIIPNSFKVPFFMKYVEDFAPLKSYESNRYCDDDITHTEEAIYDIKTMKNINDHFPSGMQHEKNFPEQVAKIVADMMAKKKEEPYVSVVDQHLNKCPTFDPKAVIEYNHKHLEYDDEGVLEVNPMKIFDYRSTKSQYLASFIDNVDIDAVIAARKRKMIEKKMQFYKQFKEDEAQDSGYPNNWECLDVERPEPHGKRKKKKTAKIQQVIEKKSVKNVQKGVKRMKIKEQKPEDDDDDEMMEFEDAIELPYYIDEVIKKTAFEGFLMEQVKSLYIKLDHIPEMSAVLHLISQVDHLKIQIDVSSDEQTCYKPKENSIKICAKNLSEIDILKTLGHQLMHCAVHWTYKNDAKPYFAVDDDRKMELERAFIGIEIKKDENCESFKKFMEKYSQDVWDVEIAGLFGEMIVAGMQDEMKKIEEIEKFLNRMMNDVKNFAMRFKAGSKGVL